MQSQGGFMKSIKNLFFCFAIAFAICFGSALFFSQKNDNTLLSYAITDTGSEILSSHFLVSQTGDEIELTDDELNKTTFSSFEEAYLFMSDGEVQSLALEFNNFKTTEALNLYPINNIKEIIVSGSIESSSNVFQISGETEFLIKCENITLSMLQETNYSFTSSNNLSTLSLGKEINQAVGIFANAEEFSIICHEQVSASDKLKIEVPANNCVALKNLIGETLDTNNQTDNFEFVCKADYYRISTQIVNNNVFSIAYIYIDFDPNGATFAEGYTPPAELKLNFDFPTKENMTNLYHDFCGWFGKFELNGKLYYFDKLMLEEFLQSQKTDADIEAIFAQSLDELDLENSFENYSEINDSNHINLFLQFEKKPTFVAKWTDSIFTLSFNTNCDIELNPLSLKFEEQIVMPILSRDGYNFEGWFDSKSLENEFVLTQMPGTDLEIFAKWSAITYTINFVDGETNIGSISGIINDTITFPSLEQKEGFKFVGWFCDKELLNEFVQTTFSNSNQTVFAKWERQEFRIIINSMGSMLYEPIWLEFGASLADISIEAPSKVGNAFVGWFLDRTYNTPFDTTLTMPAKDFTIFAKWQPILFRISFETNSPNSIISRSYYFGETIALPTPAKVLGKIFAGWFVDKNLTSAFAYNTMPAQNLVIYAKWNEKQTVAINATIQTYLTSDINFSYSGFSELSGFTVEYKIGEVWTINKPTEAGKYDVRISRGEDENFKSFETVILGGLILTGEQINLNWLIIVLFVFAGIELIAVVIIRKLVHLKKNMTLVSALPFFAYMIPTSQFVLLIISGILALFMFIMLVYQLVILHKTLPDLPQNKPENPVSSNSQIISDDEIDELFDKKETPSVDAFGSKYSAEDIQIMLAHDKFADQYKNKRPAIEPQSNASTYKSAIDISRQRSIDEQYARDELEDNIEIVDINGQKDFSNKYSSELYEHEFDNWQKHSQSDIPDDAN